MNQIEFEDLEDYVSGKEEDRHRIFLKYLKSYSSLIKAKEIQFKQTLERGELRSDAVFAVHDMFMEIEHYMDEGVEALKKSIPVGKLFNKHLTKIARSNVRENQPLAKSIRFSFKTSVAKSAKKVVYEGYENTRPVFSENTLVETDYKGSPENAHKEHVRELLNIIAPDENSAVYKDLCDHYIDSMTMREIAEQPRNNGVTKQAISKRILKYTERIGYKIKQEKYDVEI